MLQPIPWSTAVGHWLTLNWLSTTTWPIAIMICQSTDDRDVGRYVKIVCDLVYVTDQSGISALRMRLEKKNLYRWWRLSTICYTCDTLSVLDWWLTDTLLTHYQCYRHLINTLFDTWPMYSDQYVHWQLTKILACTSVDTPFMTHDRWCLCYRSKILII